MEDRAELERYLAWNRKMLADFERLAAEEETWPIEQRDANYADSVIRVKGHIVDLETRIEMLDSPDQTRTTTGFAKTEWPAA